ncbi:Uu.00g006530.m01.CDS01 [Anthostomella pinea]|uniref:Uu.00g006530.m01.CDS01 n=1 Tax=Anthostomella pinea TaxID=933095 RepID=A0AAI8VKF9_9PEZI|nr:Uu.00g006530.m01.CDS01 [Anthostomella pinea]
MAPSPKEGGDAKGESPDLAEKYALLQAKYDALLKNPQTPGPRLRAGSEASTTTVRKLGEDGTVHLTLEGSDSDAPPKRERAVRLRDSKGRFLKKQPPASDLENDDTFAEAWQTIKPNRKKNLFAKNSDQKRNRRDESVFDLMRDSDQEQDAREASDPDSDCSYSSDDDSPDSDSDNRSASSKKKKPKIDIRSMRASQEPIQRAIQWKKFKFSPVKENYLKGFENWVLYKDTLLISLYMIGWDWGDEISREGDLTIAEAIINTCKAGPIDLISGLRGGVAMIKALDKAYATSGKIHQRALWDELTKLEYDGNCPIRYTSKWQRLVCQCTDSGFKMGRDQLVTMFLSSTKSKATGWTKQIEKLLRYQKTGRVSVLIEDFHNEFKDKVGKKPDTNSSDKKNKGQGGRSHAADGDDKKDANKGANKKKKCKGLSTDEYDKDKGP